MISIIKICSFSGADMRQKNQTSHVRHQPWKRWNRPSRPDPSRKSDPSLDGLIEEVALVWGLLWCGRAAIQGSASHPQMFPPCSKFGSSPSLHTASGHRPRQQPPVRSILQARWATERCCGRAACRRGRGSRAIRSDRLAGRVPATVPRLPDAARRDSDGTSKHGHGACHGAGDTSLPKLALTLEIVVSAPRQRLTSGPTHARNWSNVKAVVGCQGVARLPGCKLRSPYPGYCEIA